MNFFIRTFELLCVFSWKSVTVTSNKICIFQEVKQFLRWMKNCKIMRAPKTLVHVRRTKAKLIEISWYAYLKKRHKHKMTIKLMGSFSFFLSSSYMCMRYRIFKTIFSVVVVVVPERYVTVVIGASSSSSSTSTTTSKRIRNKWYVMGIIIMIMYFLVKKPPVFNYYHTSEVCEEQIKHKHTHTHKKRLTFFSI